MLLCGGCCAPGGRNVSGKKHDAAVFPEHDRQEAGFEQTGKQETCCGQTVAPFNTEVGVEVSWPGPVAPFAPALEKRDLSPSQVMEEKRGEERTLCWRVTVTRTCTGDENGGRR